MRPASKEAVWTVKQTGRNSRSRMTRRPDYRPRGGGRGDPVITHQRGLRLPDALSRQLAQLGTDLRAVPLHDPARDRIGVSAGSRRQVAIPAMDKPAHLDERGDCAYVERTGQGVILAVRVERRVTETIAPGFLP